MPRVRQALALLPGSNQVRSRQAGVVERCSQPDYLCRSQGRLTQTVQHVITVPYVAHVVVLDLIGLFDPILDLRLIGLPSVIFVAGFGWIGVRLQERLAAARADLAGQEASRHAAHNRNDRP